MLQQQHAAHWQGNRLVSSCLGVGKGQPGGQSKFWEAGPSSHRNINVLVEFTLACDKKYAHGTHDLYKPKLE